MLLYPNTLGLASKTINRVGWVERSRIASRREVKPNKPLKMLGFVPQPNLRFSLTQAYCLIYSCFTISKLYISLYLMIHE